LVALAVLSSTVFAEEAPIFVGDHLPDPPQQHVRWEAPATTLPTAVSAAALRALFDLIEPDLYKVSAKFHHADPGEGSTPELSFQITGTEP
jgi:hypothetical protein